jgi:flagella basal body P-ring formation protein FlgA
MRLRFPFLVFCAYNMVQPASADFLNPPANAGVAGQPANAGFVGQPANAGEAVPNTLVTLSSPVIRVADLFANAGPRAQQVLGAAPPPGGRIVVGAGQLAAIAAAYQVPWQPDGSDPEVVLASPGRAMPAAAIDSAIAAAVASAGGPANAAITLPDFTPPMIPPGAAPGISVIRMNFDPGSQTFSASLVIEAAGMAPQNLDLAGLAVPALPALVASHDLAPGEVLTAADLTLARLPANQAAGAAASAGDAIGMAVASFVPAGDSVRSTNLIAPIIVRKGAAVLLDLSAPGMLLTAEGVALDSGGAGSLIPVLNPASHAVVQAVITGPGSASIAPGSAPLSAAQNNLYAAGGSYAMAHGGNFQAVTAQP